MGLASLATVVLLSAASLQPVAARIHCDGDFQITQFGPIATPYCQEEQIAYVANSYGWRVSAAEVHNNPLTKVYLCQTIGYDWRLQAACVGYVPHGGGPFGGIIMAFIGAVILRVIVKLTSNSPRKRRAAHLRASPGRGMGGSLIAAHGEGASFK
jgi:hypothetical protein